MASPDHAAIVREASAELADAADGVLLTRADDLRAEIVETVDALLAALAQAEQERDEARKHANKLGRELDEQGDELERAERQRDQATEALRNGMECGETVAIRAWCACVLANIEKEQA